MSTATEQPTTKHGLAHRLYTGQVSYDFIKNKRLWYTVSAVLLLASLLALVLPQRGLNPGIEFKGGTDFQVPMSVGADTVDQVRDKVEAFEVADLEAQVFSIGDSAVRIQTRSLNPDETTAVRAAIADVAAVSAEDVTYSAIGASWGKQIMQQSLVALAVFLVLVMVLIWVWFRDSKMAIAAIIALAHDLLLTLGIYAIVGFTVTPATVIGVLTILGYSLYDTVVVFDKIKENVSRLAENRMTYSQAANLAVNQVLVRSINTTVIGVLPVAALLVAGTVLNSAPLEDLGLALFVGMIAGAYSSIFIATPILATLKEREPAQVAHREALARKVERGESRTARKADLAARSKRKSVNPELEAAEAEVASFADETGAPAPREVRRTRTTRAERKRG